MTSRRPIRRVPRLRDLRIPTLPTEIPVFPLGGALLLPRGRLPLNLFEPRYLTLLEDVLAGDRLFGMIQPSDAAAAEADEDEPATRRSRQIIDDTPPALFGVGCLGRLVSFNEREDGTASIVLAGIARFRLRAEFDGGQPYRRLAVSYAGFEHDLDEVGEVAFDREPLLAALRVYFTHRGFDARWEAIEQMDDETLLTTLSMICPFPPAEKQALLEAPDLSARASTLQALLEMAGHENEEGGRPHAV
ncbi:MAG: LON peptidase substrate-binding domain-containing protein [Janthinobacterium lividum]